MSTQGLGLDGTISLGDTRTAPFAPGGSLTSAPSRQPRRHSEVFSTFVLLNFENLFPVSKQPILFSLNF